MDTTLLNQYHLRWEQHGDIKVLVDDLNVKRAFVWKDDGTLVYGLYLNQGHWIGPYFNSDNEAVENHVLIEVIELI